MLLNRPSLLPPIEKETRFVTTSRKTEEGANVFPGAEEVGLEPEGGDSR
jgi:hypothetical protein